MKLLDEREGPVPENQRHRAFNRQSPGRRIAILLAGPAFNLVFAVAAYWLMFLSGISALQPVIGGVEAGSAAEAATGRDVVITMLPDGKILRGVAGEIIPAMQKSATFLDCSTVDVDSARAVAEQAEAAGLKAVDAPVSGGDVGARSASLSIMAGGQARLIDEGRESRIAPLSSKSQ